MAYNMAASIKAYAPDLPVALVHDGCVRYMEPDWTKYVDRHIYIDLSKYKEPGRVKVAMDELSPWDETLYLDVDGCAVRDIRPLLEKLKADGRPFIAPVFGTGGLRDSINYAVWASNVSSWAWFDIPTDGKYQATQTSLVYFNKDAKPLFDYAKQKYWFPRNHLTMHWGNSIPDELIFSGAAAHLQWDVKMKGNPVFFGHKIMGNRRDIENGYDILAMYGNDRLVRLRYRMLYDWFMQRVEYITGCKPYRQQLFMKQKFVA